MSYADYRTVLIGEALPMSDGNIVHVVGTGTIGEPLIGLLCDAKEDLEIDEITFYKHNPVLTDRPKVKGLMNRGAFLSVREEKTEDFQELGMDPMYEAEEAIILQEIQKQDQRILGTGI